jgi:hypothetical protein
MYGVLLCGVGCFDDGVGLGKGYSGWVWLGGLVLMSIVIFILRDREVRILVMGV